ncbi:MAG: ABC transporter ATP-binding protein [Halovenus sp.]
MPAIETDGLTKQFGGDVLAVDDLDLTVEEGEVFGFLGPNGAGKSTTINMLLDLTRPSSGSATVLGHDAQAESQAIRERIGVLPEGYDLYDRLSGRKHVRFAIRAKDVDGDPDEILARVGLDSGDWDRDVGGYSKGMKQRLAVGMALVGDPDLLILDEPSSGLDPTGIGEVQELVRTEADRGTAVFFSSHILSEVEAVCDRIGVLNEGELVGVGTIEELQSEFAGDAQLILSLDTVPGAVDSLPGLDGVSDATVDGKTVTVYCADPEAKARAINHLEHAGATVRDIGVQDYALEEIFAELTGNGDDEKPDDGATPRTPREVEA